MKAVLLSIRPKWCGLIASGKKTIEVRKTAPKIKTPFKCYIYETKGKVERSRGEENGYIYQEGRSAVVGEFLCDRIEITNCFSGWVCPEKNNIIKRFLDGSCLSEREIVNYADGRAVCGWHISELKIYDKPRELSGFRRPCENDLYCESCGMYTEYTETCGNAALYLRRPPQSWCYVEEVDGRARI